MKETAIAQYHVRDRDVKSRRESNVKIYHVVKTQYRGKYHLLLMTADSLESFDLNMEYSV